MHQHQLPSAAAPGVAERAEVLADAACELHDAVSTSASWSVSAVEDAIEAMETTALALALAHPDATAAAFILGQTLAQLRERLGLPPGEHTTAVDLADEDQEQPVKPTPINRPRNRRGLGPGYQGLRISPGRTASGP
ncbi:hypothetical protein PV735_46850 [Streptomyces turgidiscabies]|uniref:Uncharacterized protein n=1 Tax=Streptomyces turgidiscabies (strain Car8) TaxID=698760 RepID=L7FFU7_STRT8|nr:hypothetical protein [Streptomyces turgidiscabies]ELP69951.1 hypothetical protein STRTUCAR8_00011 [Streptomyces turgidiscabies Car8]MDX3500140.1 hypothetical protein [Streptomyces turgidiscabies]GAQ77172.1 hypothetical protein T45_08988 [Streptomyces turgidiscabies]